LSLPTPLEHPWLVRHRDALEAVSECVADLTWPVFTLPLAAAWLRDDAPASTKPYAALASAVERARHLLQDAAPKAIRERERERLERAVASALFDPEGIVDQLRAVIAGDPGALEALGSSRGSGPTTHATRRLLGWLDAALLELHPLRDDGALDVDALIAARAARAAERYLDAFTSFFGVAEVLSRPSDRSVRVYSSRAREDGSRVLVTGGVSRLALLAPFAEGHRPFVELACLLPPSDPTETVAQALLDSALHGTQDEHVRLQPGACLALERPLGELTHWVFAKLDGDPWTALSAALPRAPSFLLAIGITRGEHARIVREGMVAVEPEIRRLLGLATDPTRKVSFA